MIVHLKFLIKSLEYSSKTMSGNWFFVWGRRVKGEWGKWLKRPGQVIITMSQEIVWMKLPLILLSGNGNFHSCWPCDFWLILSFLFLLNFILGGMTFAMGGATRGIIHLAGYGHGQLVLKKRKTHHTYILLELDQFLADRLRNLSLPDVSSKKWQI